MKALHGFKPYSSLTLRLFLYGKLIIFVIIENLYTVSLKSNWRGNFHILFFNICVLHTRISHKM